MEQLLICTTIKLQCWGEFYLYNMMNKWKQKKVGKNRSREPVQNIKCNIWVFIYIEIFSSHIFIYMKTFSYTYQYTDTKMKNATLSTALTRVQPWSWAQPFSSSFGSIHYLQLFASVTLFNSAVNYSILTWDQGDPVALVYFFGFTIQVTSLHRLTHNKT